MSYHWYQSCNHGRFWPASSSVSCCLIHHRLTLLTCHNIMSSSSKLEGGETTSCYQQTSAEPEPLPSQPPSSLPNPRPAGLIGFDFDLTLSCFRLYSRSHFDSLSTIFGGTERVALLQRYFDFLRQNRIRVIVISWNYKDIINEALERLDLMQYVHSIYDREVMQRIGGYRHGKAGTVGDICRRWHIELTRAVFVDDCTRYWNK